MNYVCMTTILSKMKADGVNVTDTLLLEDIIVNRLKISYIDIHKAVIPDSDEFYNYLVEELAKKKHLAIDLFDMSQLFPLPTKKKHEIVITTIM